MKKIEAGHELFSSEKQAVLHEEMGDTWPLQRRKGDSDLSLGPLNWRGDVDWI